MLGHLEEFGEHLKCICSIDPAEYLLNTSIQRAHRIPRTAINQPFSWTRCTFRGLGTVCPSHAMSTRGESVTHWCFCGTLLLRCFPPCHFLLSSKLITSFPITQPTCQPRSSWPLAFIVLCFTVNGTQSRSCVHPSAFTRDETA